MIVIAIMQIIINRYMKDLKKGITNIIIINIMKIWLKNVQKLHISINHSQCI